MQQQADPTSSFSGPLAETTRTTVELTDESGGVFVADVYTVVNVDADPDLREALLAGDLNEVDGPDGEQTWQPAVPVRVHDPDAGRYVLVIPEALAHRELELRRDLLDEFVEYEGRVPAYVRQFDAVVGAAGLEQLEAADQPAHEPPPEADRPSQDDGQSAEDTDTEASDAEPLEARRDELDDRQASLEDERAELDEQWEQLEDEREQLEVRREQLDEVEQRIERERRQMDDVEQDLVAEREELEAMRRELEEERQELEARKLQLEERERRAEAPESKPSEEVTQVVTDDQFVAVSSQVAESEGALDELSTDSSVEPIPDDEQTQVSDDDSVPDRPEDVRVTPIDRGRVPETFDEEAAGDRDHYVQVVDGTVLAACRLESERAETLTEETPAFFVQYHEIDGVPLAGLVVARLGDDGQPVESFGWPLDVADDDHRTVLNRLSEHTDLEVAVYDDDGSAVGAFSVAGPLESNVEWIRHRVEELLTAPDAPEDAFDEAAEAYLDPDFERVGQMRHNFERDAFRELDTPAQVKLAAGVVGYWSTDEVFDYLVSNRSYPLEEFRDLQEEVVDAALDEGIYLNEPLRELALETGRVTDDVELIERLLAEFAEVSVQLKANDLEPMDEWDNWDKLIEFAQDVGVTPDPEVIELAEASLKRAQDYQEAQEVGAEDVPEPEPDAAPAEPSESPEPEGDRTDTRDESDQEDADQTAEDFLDDPAAVDVETLVVGKRSETTGVTYYLPDAAVIDTFDDLADMPREDLEKLLKDPNGRLEAAQMLLERFDGSVVPEVMERAEKMSAPEVTALARFLETKAEGLEADLVRTVESAGPSATFVAARALAHIRSTSAIPTLIEAFRDDDRNLNRRAVARTLANYGDKLVPPLSRSVQENGADDHVVLLLQHLEEAEPGILDELATDRNEDVRNAVEQARNTAI